MKKREIKVIQKVPFFKKIKKIDKIDGGITNQNFNSQLFWLVLTFATLYFIITYIILPRIRENIRLRKNKISKVIFSDIKLSRTINDIFNVVIFFKGN